MSDDDGIPNPKDLLIDDSDADGGDGLVSRVYSFLGIERDAYVCEDCQAACEPAYAYDPARAAFDGGESPTWYCSECDRHFVRERTEQEHAVDLYGRE